MGGGGGGDEVDNFSAVTGKRTEHFFLPILQCAVHRQLQQRHLFNAWPLTTTGRSLPWCVSHVPEVHTLVD